MEPPHDTHAPRAEESKAKGPLVVKGRMIMDSTNQNWAGTSAVPLSDANDAFALAADRSKAMKVQLAFS